MTLQEKWDQIRDRATLYWKITEIFHDELAGPLEVVFFAATDGHANEDKVAAVWRDRFPSDCRISVQRAGLFDLRKEEE